MNKAETKTRSEWGFVAALAVCFLATVLLLMTRHEMWRDEIEPWMIARYSASFRDLLAHARYEGHPILWYLVLFVVTRFSDVPQAMQYANALIATGMVALFARYSPFSRLFKVLFAFSFFPLFQYGVISRGYALCTFVLFLLCVAYPMRKTRLPVVALVMMILANADFFGWFYCAAFSLGIAVEWIVDRRRRERWSASIPEFAMCVLIVLAGMFFAMRTCTPPADGGWFMEWHTTFEASRLWKALCGLAFDANVGRPIIYVIPTLALFAWFTWSIRRHIGIVVTWVTFVAAIGLFYYVKLLPYFWHKGMVLIMMVACLWLYVAEKELLPHASKPKDAGRKADGRSFATVFACVLALYVVYGGKWIAQDLLLPYSTTRLAADYIKQHSLANSFIVGDPDFVTQSVSAYLDRPIFYTASNSIGRYVVWNNRRNWPRTDTMDRLAAVRARVEGRVIYIGNSRSLPTDHPKFKTRLLKAFDRGVLEDERLWIYEVERTAQDAPARTTHGG